MKKTGRPPLPKENLLSEIIKFRVTKKEKEAMEKAAQKLNFNASEYLRFLLFNRMKNDPVIDQERLRKNWDWILTKYGV